MMDSILNTIKLKIGYEPDYTPFDTEITDLINTALRRANQLGVGKPNFIITGPDETWQDFLGDNVLLFADVKTYIYIYVKLIHDPPSNSFLITNLKDEMSELEWRMNVNHETPFVGDNDE